MTWQRCYECDGTGEVADWDRPWVRNVCVGCNGDGIAAEQPVLGTSSELKTSAEKVKNFSHRARNRNGGAAR